MNGLASRPHRGSVTARPTDRAGGSNTRLPRDIGVALSQSRLGQPPQHGTTVWRCSGSSAAWSTRRGNSFASTDALQPFRSGTANERHAPTLARDLRRRLQVARWLEGALLMLVFAILAISFFEFQLPI